MKIKTWINNIIAIFAVVTLVGGFQVDSAADSQLTSAAVSIETAIGVEEAYAGPCGRRGCDGSNTYCGTYTVLEIGGIHIVRHCDGNKKETEKQIEMFN
jgi:hypothetical protein